MNLPVFFSSDPGKTLITFLISMVPIFECRAAIPTGVAMGLPTWLVFVTSAIGNFLPAPFIVLFIKKIFAWMRKISPKFEHIVAKLESKADGKKADKIRKYSALGLILFVGIPLPGTGAWTGALIAAMLDIKLRHAAPAIALGVLLACVLVSFLSVGAKAAIMLF